MRTGAEHLTVSTQDEHDVGRAEVLGVERSLHAVCRAGQLGLRERPVLSATGRQRATGQVRRQRGPVREGILQILPGGSLGIDQVASDAANDDQHQRQPEGDVERSDRPHSRPVGRPPDVLSGSVERSKWRRVSGHNLDRAGAERSRFRPVRLASVVAVASALKERLLAVRTVRDGRSVSQWPCSLVLSGIVLILASACGHSGAVSADQSHRSASPSSASPSPSRSLPVGVPYRDDCAHIGVGIEPHCEPRVPTELPAGGIAELLHGGTPQSFARVLCSAVPDAVVEQVLGGPFHVYTNPGGQCHYDKPYTDHGGSISVSFADHSVNEYRAGGGARWHDLQVGQLPAGYIELAGGFDRWYYGNAERHAARYAGQRTGGHGGGRGTVATGQQPRRGVVRHRVQQTRWTRWPNCCPRPRISACTWSSCGAPVARAGRCTSRYCSACATSRHPA
jgi:hypothetical protein